MAAPFDSGPSEFAGRGRLVDVLYQILDRKETVKVLRGRMELAMLRPNPIPEPFGCQSGEIAEIDVLVGIQITRADRPLENAGAIGRDIGNLSRREGIVVDLDIIDEAIIMAIPAGTDLECMTPVIGASVPMRRS